jgi:hypothetical protein
MKPPTKSAYGRSADRRLLPFPQHSNEQGKKEPHLAAALTEPFHYNAVKWTKIKQSLAVIGVDADTATVLDGKAQCSLQAKLGWLAQRYRSHAQVKIPTARRFVDEITAQRDKIAAVRDLFAPQCWVAFVIGDARAAEIHRLLTTVETKLQGEVKKVFRTAAYDEVVRHEGRQHNAGKPALRDYLLRLAKVWHKLAGESGEPRHRNRFVHACAAPVADVTVKNVRDFLSDKKTKTAI